MSRQCNCEYSGVCYQGKENWKKSGFKGEDNEFSFEFQREMNGYV